MNSFFTKLLPLILIGLLSVAYSSTSISDDDSDKKLFAEIDTLIKLKQFARARLLLLPLARKGNDEARYHLAVLYRNGYILKKNYKKSHYWLNLASKNNHAKSIFASAMMQLKGQGIEQNPVAARKKLKRSAKLGYKPAINQLLKLANRSRNFKLTKKDFAEFRKAIRTGDIVRIRAYLKRKIDINRTDENGNNSLMIAIESNQRKSIKLIMRKNPDYSMINRHRETVLMIAIKNRYEKHALMLLQKGDVVKGINQQDLAGNHALLSALKFDLLSVASKLIQLGVDLEVVDSHKRNAYLIAKDKQQKNILQQLLDAGYNNEKNQRKIATFTVAENIAAKHENDKLVKNPFANWTALMIASWRGDKKAVSDLVKVTTNINHVDEEGHSALSRAAWKGHQLIVKKLLRNGAKVDLVQKDGSTAIHWASLEGHSDVVKLLLENSADINHFRHDKKTPLMLSVINNKIDTAKFLLKNRAQLNVLDENKRSVLIYAIMGGHEDFSIMLLGSSANPELIDDKHRNALWYAINYDRTATALHIIGMGVDISQPDYNGDFLITQAVKNDNYEISKQLLEQNIDVNLESNYGNSALNIASQNGYITLAKLLIDNNADLNHKNSIGDTPLINCARNNKILLCEMLLRSGADVNKKNTNRQTALDIAKNQQKDELIRLLEEKKANSGFWPF